MTDIKFTPEDLHDHDAIGAVIKNERGEILMQEHVKYRFWTIPLGKAKIGQDAVQGMKTEVFEECGIDVIDYALIARRDYDYEREGRIVHPRAHIFEVLEYSGEILNKEPHKHKRQIFLSIEKISELPFLSDMTLLYLETLGIKRKAVL